MPTVRSIRIDNFTCSNEKRKIDVQCSECGNACVKKYEDDFRYLRVKKINIFLFLLIFLKVAPVAFAKEKNDRFYYCGGSLNFHIPNSVKESPLVPENCKEDFILESRIGGKRLSVSTLVHTERIFNPKQYVEDAYLKKHEKEDLRHFYSFLTAENKTGDVVVITHYWSDGEGIVKDIQKDLIFASNESSFTVYASYIGSLEDPNEIVFLTSIEQIFLSMEID